MNSLDLYQPPAEAAISLGDIVAMVRRRAPFILATVGIVMTVASIVIALLPDVFEARSVVLVKAAQVPETYKRTGYIVPRLSDLVVTLRQETLGRDTLANLINELDLYDLKGLKAGGTDDGAIGYDPIERARKDVKIDIVKRGPNDFVEISARARTAALAKKAVDRISDVLSAKNKAERLRQEQDAKTFVESQLIGAQRKLQEAETALVRFREDNVESLPENKDQLLDRLSKLRFDKQVAQDRLQKAQLTILELQRRIEAIRAGSPPPGLESADRRALETELARLISEESDLISRGYGPGWPALARVQARLKRTREQLAVLETGAVVGGAGPAAGSKGGDDERTRALLAQVSETSGVVAAIERELEHNAAETARLEMLKGAFVQTSAKLDKLLAVHREASAEHKALLDELRDVEWLIAAEEMGRTDHFRMIEPAFVPPFPASPKRPLLLGAALVGALASGFGLAYLLELLRPAYRDAQDVEADLRLDVLAILPEIPETARDAVAGRKRAPVGVAA